MLGKRALLGEALHGSVVHRVLTSRTFIKSLLGWIFTSEDLLGHLC